MKSKKGILTALIAFALAAWACGGPDVSPQLPSTIVPSQTRPTAGPTQPKPAATPAQPMITQVAATEASALETSVPQENGPLLLLITQGGSTNGDLWAWDAPGRPLRQLTNYGYNYSPVISPDGRYVVYDSIPKEDVPWQCSGWPPANIWVLEIASGDAFRIAEQPPDSSPGSCGGATFIQRPQVAWSPDSKALAWGEHQEPDTTGRVSYHLVVYDLEQRSQRIMASDLPGYQGITDGQQVDWGEPGIADFTSPDNLLVIYDGGGMELLRTQLDADFNACPVGPSLSARWVLDGASSALYVKDCSDPSRQYLINPVIGKPSPTTGRLELYSLTAPDALRLFMTEDSSGDGLWHVVAPGGLVADLDVKRIAVNENPSVLDLVAISPDGRHVAYLSDTGLMLLTERGQAVPVDVMLKADQEISWVGWGPTGWRISHP